MRWLPVGLALVALGVGGWTVDRYRKHEIAAQVMKAIGHGDRWEMTTEEAKELQSLSTAGYSAAFQALHLACQDGPTAARASKRVSHLASMAIGLDPTGVRSSDFAEKLVVPTLENAQADQESVRFAATLASQLHLVPSAAKQVAASMVSRMKTESDSNALAHFGLVLASLSARLERQDVVPAAEILVARIKTETNFNALAHLSWVLTFLSARLERQDVVPAAETLVARIKTETNSDALARLATYLGSLSAKLERQDVVPGAETLVARMKTMTNSDALASLGNALGSLSAKLERQDVVPGAKILVARMKTGSIALIMLGNALGSLSAKLERQDVVPGAETLVARMKTVTNSDALASLGNSLGSLSAKLEPQDVVSGAEILVARMKTETNSRLMLELGSAFASLGAKLEKQHANLLAKSLVPQGNTETDAYALAGLGSAFASLSVKLDGKDIAPVFDALVVRIYTEWNTEALAGSLRESPSLLKATVALGSSLPSPFFLSVYSEPVRVEQVYVDLLKSPFVVGSAREQLLEGLEKATGQSFSGNLWSFVDWATTTPEGRALGLDLDGPPPWSTEPLIAKTSGPVLEN